MLSDPISFTINGSSKTFPRVSVDGNTSVYRTSDGEYEVIIHTFPMVDGKTNCSVTLNHLLPDSTPSDPFDPWRPIVNSFGLTYSFDTNTRANVGTDIPILRTALLAFIDSTLQGRVINGEK